MSTIVVGVDGSEGARRALRFAVGEARVHGDDVKAVSAWSVPAVAYEGAWGTAAFDPGEYRKIAHDLLERELAAADVADSGVSVTPLVREGHPADVLRAEAREARLLVVGSRGLGGFRGLLLGSVSQQVAHHAPCPLAIVPAAASEAAP